jgi:hypothetical protein
MLDGVTLGARGDGTTQGSYDVGEVIVYPRALAVTEIAQVDAYLKVKWGTP